MANVGVSWQPATSRRALAALPALVAGYALFYSVLSLLRFETFHAQIDMSYYLRLVWGLGHGHYDLPLVQAPHVLGLHLEPVLLPLALLSALGVPVAPVLLVLQAAAVALLAWPAYRLARRHLPAPGGAEGAALPAALLALLYPTVTVATLHDFHPVTLALAPLLGVIDALDEGARRRALWLGAVALGCREDIALQLALLCAVEAPRLQGPGGARRRCMLLAAGLLGYFAAYVFWLQPRFLPAAGSYGLHFQELGGAAARSGRDVALFALRHPLRFLGHLGGGGRLLYPVTLLWPVAFLPLLAPRYLLAALPVAAINLLSDFPRVRTIEAHYATGLVPFVVGPAILGLGRAVGWLRRRGPEPLARAPLLLYLLLALLAHERHGASPLAWHSARFRRADFVPGAGFAETRAAVRSVPAGASVAARPGPLAHLAERPRAISPPEYDDGRPVDVRLPTF